MDDNPFVGDLMQPRRIKDLLEQVTDREIETLADFFRDQKKCNNEVTKVAEIAIDDKEYQRLLVNLLVQGNRQTFDHILSQIEYNIERFDSEIIEEEFDKAYRMGKLNDEAIGVICNSDLELDF